MLCGVIGTAQAFAMDLSPDFQQRNPLREDSQSMQQYDNTDTFTQYNIGIVRSNFIGYVLNENAHDLESSKVIFPVEGIFGVSRLSYPQDTPEPELLSILDTPSSPTEAKGKKIKRGTGVLLQGIRSR